MRRRMMGLMSIWNFISFRIHPDVFPAKVFWFSSSLRKAHWLSCLVSRVSCVDVIVHSNKCHRRKMICLTRSKIRHMCDSSKVLRITFGRYKHIFSTIYLGARLLCDHQPSRGRCGCVCSCRTSCFVCLWVGVVENLVSIWLPVVRLGVGPPQRHNQSVSLLSTIDTEVTRMVQNEDFLSFV